MNFKFITVSLSFVTLLNCKKVENSSQVQVAGNQIGQYKSLSEITKILETKFFSRQGDHDPDLLSQFTTDGMRGSMPSHQTTPALENIFKNGAPNALNYLLWNITFRNLSRELSYICTPRPNGDVRKLYMKPKQEFESVILNICAWDKQKKIALESLWDSAMSYGFPEEKTRWLNYFVNKSKQELTTTQQHHLQTILISVWMHPKFLLEN